MAVHAEQPGRVPATVSRDAAAGARRRAMAWVWTSAWPLLIVLTGLWLAPRLTDLNREVTVDETLWLGRSANFSTALAHADFAATYQAPHPGVTTMWAGAFGLMAVFPDYPRVHPAQFAPDRRADLLMRSLGHDPLATLVAMRVAKVLLQGAMFALAYVLMRRVFGRTVAALAAILIAADPFLIAHDRLLHIDGLFAITTFVSLLALLAAIQPATCVDRRLLALAGLFAALAWLTRITGAALVPFTLLVLAIDGWRRSAPQGRRWRVMARPFAVAAAMWGGVAAVATFALWPALWVNPLACLRRIVSYSLAAASQGHERGIFFAGETYHGDPGLWYYPVVLVWRATPVVLIGLALVGVAVLCRRRFDVLRGRWGAVAAVAGFAVLWLVLMSDGAKKFDRYVLPDFPALDLLAAAGFVAAARWLGHMLPDRHLSGWRRLSRAAPAIVLSVALLGQGASAASSAPYYLTWFNPALGGTTGASRDLLLGWGEGLDQAAAFILSRPDGATATVRSSMVRSSWSMFFPPTVSARGNSFTARMQSVLDWYDTDYYISYVSQWQRQSDPDEITGYLARFPPIHTVQLKGQTFARVYDLREIPPPSWVTDTQRCAFGFGDQIELVAWRDEGESFHGLRRGQQVRRLQLLFLTGAVPGTSYTVNVALLPRTIAKPDPSLTARIRFTPAMGGNLLGEAWVGLPLPPGKTFADYNVLITLRDATGAPVPATQLMTGMRAASILLPSCK